jgi:hypothetical protein
MSGFTKLDSGIVDSSIWDEDAETCKLWITILALADSSGFVRGSEGWIARKSKVPLEKCIQALKAFESPDPASRNPANEGRRLSKNKNGWTVLNYKDFRQFSYSNSPEAIRTRRHRENQALQPLQTVTCNETPLQSASASASEVPEGGTGGNRKSPTLEEVKLTCAKAGIPESDAVWFWNKCEGNGWTNGGKKIKSYPHTLAAWKAAGYLPSQKPVQSNGYSKPAYPPQKTIAEKEADSLLRQLARENL